MNPGPEVWPGTSVRPGGSAWRTTGQLAAAVAAIWGHKASKSRTHPATRAFQALRIAVNQELAELEKFLEGAPNWLEPGGRLGDHFLPLPGRPHGEAAISILGKARGDAASYQEALDPHPRGNSGKSPGSQRQVAPGRKNQTVGGGRVCPPTWLCVLAP